MASFADVQYWVYADLMGVSEKVQNYADVNMVPKSKLTTYDL